MRISTVVLAATFVIAASSSAFADMGDSGAQCYPNKTCNSGLKCVDDKCVLNAGGEGLACYKNQTCDAGLACRAGTCVRDFSAQAKKACDDLSITESERRTCNKVTKNIKYDPTKAIAECVRAWGPSEDILDCVRAIAQANRDPSAAIKGCATGYN